MHCSVNVGLKTGDAAVFFGLSRNRQDHPVGRPGPPRWMGDDEHGWGDTAMFNFEGGCYAKVINLSGEQEPQIHALHQRKFGTMLGERG